MCSRYGITIAITYYPGLRIDIDKIIEIAQQNSVNLYFCDNSNNEDKYSIKYKIDSDKSQPLYSFIGCWQMNNCSVLSNGKIHLCPMSACIEYFNDYFGKHFEVTDNDSIDIYKASSFDEISNFTSTPVPFCRYCDVGHREFYKWATSKKVIDEYI
jgi:hypothetical protein